MQQDQASPPRRFRAYGRQHIDRLPVMDNLSEHQRIALKAVSAVLPFRVNDYVLDELIDWDDIPSDPMYQLVFPQVGMLARDDFNRLRDLIVGDASDELVAAEARAIQMRMNPHPSGQLELNVPTIGGEPLEGCQHKYRETVLSFPARGQTCHAYCTYCFRWAQFVGVEKLRFANHDPAALPRYLALHPEVSDVLVTGGDPMIMSSAALRACIEPLLKGELEHVTSIRIGTKSLAYWPHRFTTDRDADDVLRLFEQVRRSGRQLALMAHVSHPRELEPSPVRLAVRRILDTGAVIRCQAPLIRHVNDDGDAWAEMWREQVRLGAVPYYMFVERDTGPKHYFEVPLARALRIFNRALGQVSGLGRTVRGPSMSATPGKVLVEGVTTIGDERVFVLKFIQGRDPDWTNRVFFARFDSTATWLDDLEPVPGEREHFFEPTIRAMAAGRWRPDWAAGEEDEEEMTA
ncbi:MAG TPA: lysine 2,3-aminomutase [Methylomirabilota bacterium]|nr:lysine 2,3-aminomutase [Methylomirabilota bacterium]